MNRNDFGMLDPFERMAQSFWAPLENMDQTLKTDINETDDQYQVKVDVPGIDKQDVKLDHRDPDGRRVNDHVTENCAKC